MRVYSELCLPCADEEEITDGRSVACDSDRSGQRNLRPVPDWRREILETEHSDGTILRTSK